MIHTERTDKQERFIQLRAKGTSYSDITAALGISKGTCSNWSKQFAAEIEQARERRSDQPRPRANKKRIVDITDKLELRTDSGKLSVAHFKTPEFKERYERGELTPEEAEGVETIRRTAHEVGETLSKSWEVFSGEWQHTAIAAKKEWKQLDAAIVNMVEGLAPAFDELARAIEKRIAELPPEEQAEIRAELEKKERKSDRRSDRSGKPTGEIVTATLSNLLLDKVYAAALNGTATAQLTTINTTVNKPKIDAVTGNAIFKRGSFALSIENYRNTAREFKVSTHKLLRTCTILLARGNNYREKNPASIHPTVVFSLEDYMKLLNLPDTKANKDRLRRIIKSDLDTLINTKLSWTEHRKGKAVKNGDFLSIPIIGGKTGIYKGNVVVTFSKEMSEYLVQSAFLTQFNLELLRVDERNANVYPLGEKLLMHSSIDRNILRNTANIISVQKALEACPDIPKYTELQARGERHWERYIKDTLEKALDRLTFMRWEYSNPKGEPLTNEQLAIMDYHNFIGLYIRFEMIGAPDQTERLKAKADRAAARAKKANKKKEQP